MLWKSLLGADGNDDEGDDGVHDVSRNGPQAQFWARTETSLQKTTDATRSKASVFTCYYIYFTLIISRTFALSITIA